MRLSELLEHSEYSVMSGTTDVEITGISRDNRKAAAGDLFICTTGARFDTHECEAVSYTHLTLPTKALV